MRILLLDNYDSFTYNLLHLVEKVSSFKVDVLRNDAIALDDVEIYDKIMLSPGPGLPSEAGIMPYIIKKYSPQKSILGVCLGHQAIAEAFGGTLINLPEPYHGVSHKTNVIQQDQLFDDLPKTFDTGRYHSWSVQPVNLPKELEIIAIDNNHHIMALRHCTWNVRGIQFHPESILTSHGEQLISNWLKI